MDNAVAYLVLVIEGALYERDEVTVMGRKESTPRHTLPKLLDRTFKLDLPKTGPKSLMEQAAAGDGLIKVWPGRATEASADDNQLDS